MPSGDVFSHFKGKAEKGAALRRAFKRQVKGRSYHGSRLSAPVIIYIFIIAAMRIMGQQQLGGAAAGRAGWW